MPVDHAGAVETWFSGLRKRCPKASTITSQMTLFCTCRHLVGACWSSWGENWSKKGESKKFGNGTVLCVDRNLKVDTTAERAEGDILIMLTNDEYPDDTIKIRFKIEAVIYENSLEIQDQSTYYLDSEGNENPLNYTNFLELFQMLDNSI